MYVRPMPAPTSAGKSTAETSSRSRERMRIAGSFFVAHSEPQPRARPAAQQQRECHGRSDTGGEDGPVERPAFGERAAPGVADVDLEEDAGEHARERGGEVIDEPDARKA